MNILLAILMIFSWPFSDDHKEIQEINTIKERMKSYYSSNLDSAAFLADQIRIKSREIGYDLGIAKGEFAVAYVAFKQGKISKSIPHFFEAISLYEPLTNTEANTEANTDKAYIYLTLGKIYKQHHCIHLAHDFYNQGISFAKAANNDVVCRMLLYNQSVAYRNEGDLVKAMDVLTQSMALISEHDKAARQRTYNQFGLIYKALGDYEQARSWYNKMIALESDDIVPNYYRSQAYHNIALTYNKENNFSMAWKYFKLAASEKELIGNADKLFITYHDMAALALRQGNPQAVNKYAHAALALIDDVPTKPDYFKIYKLLSESLVDQNPVLAVSYAQQFINESEKFGSIQRKMAENGDRYKVQLIATNYFNSVKREKERLKIAWSMSCAAIFILLVMALTYKLYRIYRYRSPKLALSHIKNHNEMVFLLDLFRKEKEEMRNTMKQRR